MLSNVFVTRSNMRVLSALVCFVQFWLNAHAFVGPVSNFRLSLLTAGDSRLKKLGTKTATQLCSASSTSFSRQEYPMILSTHRMVTSGSSTSLSRDQDGSSLPAYSKFGRIKVKGRDLSIPVGILFFLAVFGWVFILYPPLLLAFGYSALFDQKRKRAVDWVIHLWAKMAMLTVTYKPTVRGVENLPPASESVMYIPNHCSYLDIFTLSGFLPRPFKYVSKIEVLRIPLIGWAMRLAGHIAIMRTDKRSQLQTFKDTVQALQDGSSVVTFAEGTRSSDGRLAAFKRGPIKMALKAGVRIVPVSIADLYRFMPDSAIAPLAVPRRVVVTIHPPIDPAALGGEDATAAAVFAAVNSGLPAFQQADPALLAKPAAAD